MEFCKICLKRTDASKPSESPGYHDACKKRLFGKGGVSPRLSFDKKQFGSEIARQFTKRMSMSGLQQKLSMKIEGHEIRPTDVGGTHILKPTAAEYDHVSENEHVSMLIGNALGIETPPCGLVSFSNGELAYIVKRFDRRDDGTKLAQEDLAQIMGIQKESSGEFKYAGSYEGAGRSVHLATGGKLAVVLRFFERVLYNFIICNSDFHLKNVSLRNIDASGKYQDLTPNYDSLNTFLHFGQGNGFFALNEGLYPEQYDTEPYQSLGFPTERDFHVLGLKLGLHARVMGDVFDGFYKKAGAMHELINSSYLSTESKGLYAKLVDERIAMLKKAPAAGPSAAKPKKVTSRKQRE